MQTMWPGVVSHFVFCLYVLRKVYSQSREPAIGLIKWLRPKGLEVCSYVEKCIEFKNQTFKKSAGTQRCYAQRNTPGVGNISKERKNGGILVGR